MPGNKEFYVEQERIQKHLAELSAEGLAELESEALKSSPSFLAKNFQRAVGLGKRKPDPRIPSLPAGKPPANHSQSKRHVPQQKA